MTRLAPFPQTVFWILRRGYQKRNKEKHHQSLRRSKTKPPSAIQIPDASFHSKSVWGLLASALPSTKHARQILRNPVESQSAQGVRSAGTRIMSGTDSSCIKPSKRTNKSRNNMKPRKETERGPGKKKSKATPLSAPPSHNSSWRKVFYKVWHTQCHKPEREFPFEDFEEALSHEG